MNFKLIGYMAGEQGAIPCEDVRNYPSLASAQEDAKTVLKGDNDFDYIEIYEGEKKVDTIYRHMLN